MASVVNICNLALAHLGDSANIVAISPPDGSAQAAYCAQFYPIARDALLEMHAWDFATKREALALIVGVSPSALFSYQYAIPSTMVKAWVLNSAQEEFSEQSFPFILETLADGSKALLTNTPDAILKYTFQVTDTTKFSSNFVNALSWLLASYLAGPITKDIGKKSEATKVFKAELALATTADANTGGTNIRARYTPGSAAARG